jgi:N-acetylglucosamine-6-phosphate deacetylase
VSCSRSRIAPPALRATTQDIGSTMRTLISGGTLLTPHQELPDHTLVIEGSQIVALQPGALAAGPGERRIDARGLGVVPGLIDVHVHGGAGHDAMDATPTALAAMGRFFARHGVTAYLPTTFAAPGQTIQAAIDNVACCPQPAGGARHLGLHLEGPYCNPEHRGAQPLEQIRPPDHREYSPWLEGGWVRLVTLAPELEGALALIEAGSSRGVEFAVGHSGASYEQVLAAADRGLRQATHTFNGMLGLHHRTPGTAGAVLADERIYAQVIADGVHVHPAVVRVLVRAKGVDRVILITDAMRATGLGDGDYDLGGHPIAVRSGIARTAAGGLAGSTLTLDEALRRAMRFADLPLVAALHMVTATPAAALGLAGRKGTLAPGADADVVLLDSELRVRLTLVAGQVAYRDMD